MIDAQEDAPTFITSNDLRRAKNTVMRKDMKRAKERSLET